ncbi:pleckstrin homology domain-containing family F member 1 [Melanotaenia boesemani]|uniref:pleckstrin homology domain-containing family F member 1 n=1 Tax=Melanotaenia boesemani TaxID=1250792 RepID=UPI001C04489A|nr:pleckstrin homology domain-containing family F member 1 [Melanotaenia boesemani]
MATMVERLTFAQENRERIQAVDIAFGSRGKSLSQPDRILVGEGRLMKQSRRGLQPKVFFLFNDVLVYGSILLNGRWYNKQQVIPLGDIQVEDLENSLLMKNQWLIRTPRKSFYVGAASYEEKQAWIEHITDCQSRLLQEGQHTLRSNFAATWIPDQASAICMRCSNKFTVTQRRHHCRNCGFVVCRSCSKKRAVIRHIHPTKQQRVCSMCHSSLLGSEAGPEERTRMRGDSTGKMGSDEDEVDGSSEEEVEDNVEDHDPSRWMASWSPYVYLKPEHIRPQTDSSGVLR